MRAICTLCGGVVSWSAKRGVKLADFKHKDLIKTDCVGKLTAYRESRMAGQLLGVIDSYGRSIIQ